MKLNTAQDVEQSVKDINGMTGLTEVRLSGNTFGVEAARAIAEALSSQEQLKVAILSDMFTGRLKDEIPLALDALVDALLNKKHLVELDLSDNAFGPAGAKPLMRLLTGNRGIQTLRLNNNGLGIEGGRLIAEALVKAQELNVKEGRVPALQVVVAGRNRLESTGASHLAKAFEAFSESLHTVRMPQNSIRPDGIAVLVQSLKKCRLLEHLDLQDNTFTKEGSIPLANAVGQWPNLKVLNLADCLLKPAGACAILKGLAKGNNQLQHVNLSFNEISDKAAAYVPAMLANKTQLEAVLLNGNVFDAEGDAVGAIRRTLASLGKEDALDELDEMEEDEEEDEEEDWEADLDDAILKDKAVDALADAIEKLGV